MESERPSSSREVDREHQAAAWLARRDRGLTAAEQDAFFQWLAEDPRHGDWLARHQQTVQGLKLLAQWRPEHGARPNPDLLARPRARGRRGWGWAVGLSAAASVALAVAVWRPWPAGGQFAATTAIAAPDPQARRRVLEDGSTIDLNRDAAVEVRYSATERRVRLVRGEASFNVSKSPSRPFVVEVKRVEIRAVGTAFNVKLEARSVEVLVTEGQVRVRSPEQPAAVQEVPLVVAGQQAIISLLEVNATPTVTTLPAHIVAQRVAWQFRQLEFTDAPLAQVVAEFNRDNRVKLVVEDPWLAALPIGATLRSDNVEGFVRLLETGFHVSVERPTDGVIVLRRGAAGAAR